MVRCICSVPFEHVGRPLILLRLYPRLACAGSSRVGVVCDIPEDSEARVARAALGRCEMPTEARRPGFASGLGLVSLGHAVLARGVMR